MTKTYAICDGCHQPMAPGNGCGQETVEVRWERGRYVSRIRYFAPRARDKRTEPCHDCNVAPGQFHHVGCDMEICPMCGGQAIACECP